jgi:uncharacterized membrane protein YphA (DoxX/SURF4 family)
MGAFISSWSIPVPGGWLALVRVWVGVIWTWQSLELFWTGLYRDLTPKMGRMASTNPRRWYRAFLEKVMLPRARLVSPILSTGQLAIGLALIAGIFIRAAAALGILLNINYYFAASQNFPPNRPLNFLMIGIQLILIAGDAGTSLSSLLLLP